LYKVVANKSVIVLKEEVFVMFGLKARVV